MTYLFVNDQEIKNDSGNAISVTGNVAVSQITSPWVVTGNVSANIAGTVTVQPFGASSTSAFGEPYAVQITPVIQLDSIYGVTSEVIQTYTSGANASAGANVTTAMWEVKSGTSVGGYGVLRTKRFLRYRPGQGALTRFTAAFTEGIANSTQRAGLFNQENAIQIGYNGTTFGVLRATGGKAHKTVLTINTAPNATQTVTLILNGVTYSFSISAGTTTQAAAEIVTHDAFAGWLIDQVDNTVVFMADSLGVKSGTFSFSSAGNATGSFSTKQAGVAQTENWTPQYDWNIDTLGVIDPATGQRHTRNPSGMTLDPTKLNVYQINFRWLGAGEIRYAIEDQTTGSMVFFHREHYTNQNLIPHVAQPSFKIGYVTYSLGSTTNLKVTGASIMGAIEGTVFQNELNRSTSTSKSTLASNTLHHLLTLRNPYVTNGAANALNGTYVLNAKECILKNISVATQGNDPGIIYIFYEPTSFSGTHLYSSQPKDNEMISTETGTLNATTDTAITRFVTAINGQASYDLAPFRIAIPPGSFISIGIQSTSQLSRVSVALVFSED